jgi:hypothetical protein
VLAVSYAYFVYNFGMVIALRKAYRDLTRRKLRSFLTVIGIIIGVAGIVAITSTSKNMTAAQVAVADNVDTVLHLRGHVAVGECLA